MRPDGIADLAAYFKFATETDMLNIMRTITIRDLRPRCLALSGRQRTKEVSLVDGGLRGWDGESCSLREYTETETGRTLWAYLPASPALCHVRQGEGTRNGGTIMEGLMQDLTQKARTQEGRRRRREGRVESLVGREGGSLGAVNSFI